MRVIRAFKKFFQVCCGLTYLVGTLQACSSIDFDSPVINAIISFGISGVFFFISLICQRYEDWRRAENNRIAHNIAKFHDASRLSGL